MKCRHAKGSICLILNDNGKCSIFSQKEEECRTRVGGIIHYLVGQGTYDTMVKDNPDFLATVPVEGIDHYLSAHDNIKCKICGGEIIKGVRENGDYVECINGHEYAHLEKENDNTEKCRVCGGELVEFERRINGYVKCINGHKYKPYGEIINPVNNGSMQETQIVAKPIYIVDWEKVKTFEDLKELLKKISITFEHDTITGIEHLVMPICVNPHDITIKNNDGQVVTLAERKNHS